MQKLKGNDAEEWHRGIDKKVRTFEKLKYYGVIEQKVQSTDGCV